MKERRIKTIIFDLSEVYLRGLWMVEEKLEKIIKMPKEVIKKMLFSEPRPDFDLLMEGKIMEEEYWNRLIKNNHLSVSVAKLKKAARDNFEEIEGTRAIIEELKKQGYNLGLLSNHSKEWIDYCEKKFDYHKLFHSVLYSFEIGICKPDKKVYEHILTKLNAKPEECLFIDDIPKNLRRAEELEIKTILFENSTQLKRELRKFDIILK